MSKIITLDALKSAGACADALQHFAAEFGGSTPVTPALAGKYADQFDWAWAADHLLSAAARAEYETASAGARAEYDRAVALAQAKRNKVVAPARVAREAAATAGAAAFFNRPTRARKDAVAHIWAECDRVLARAWAEYGRAVAPARAEYDRAVALAQAKRNKAYARAWATLYIKEGI
jgi:cell division septum initiation protein DivIVA